MVLKLLLFLAFSFQTTIASYCKYGVDVSHHNGKVDWQKVKNDGISFAPAKATEGGTFQDPMFVQNWNGMLNVGIQPVAYHYLRGSLPSNQYQNIWNVLFNGSIKFDPEHDILAIDVEEAENEKMNRDVVATILWSLLDQLTSIIDNVYIYANHNYWNNKVAWEMYDFSKFPLWVAHWTNRTEPELPITWTTRGWTWWQCTDKAQVAGINGNVHINIWKC